MARVRRRRSVAQHARIDAAQRADVLLGVEVARARLARAVPGLVDPRHARDERWWSEVGHPYESRWRHTRWVRGEGWVHIPGPIEDRSEH